jgi:hypothetical protein
MQRLLAAQRSELHGYGPVPTTDHAPPGVRRRIWSRPNRPPSVELWTLKHQGHAFPVDPGPWEAVQEPPLGRLPGEVWTI